MSEAEWVLYPCQDISSEMAFIGALLMASPAETDIAVKALHEVRSGQLRMNMSRKVIRGIRSLEEKRLQASVPKGWEVDLILVYEEMRRLDAEEIRENQRLGVKGAPDEVPFSFLKECVDHCDIPQNVGKYLTLIQEKSSARDVFYSGRALEHAAKELQRRAAYPDANAENLIAAMQLILVQISAGIDPNMDRIFDSLSQ